MKNKEKCEITFESPKCKLNIRVLSKKLQELQKLDYTLDERREMAKVAKEQGKKAFIGGDLKQAEYEYKRAVEYINWDKESQEIMNLQRDCLNNLALLSLKTKKYSNGISFCNQVLELDELNVKALQRRSKCNSELKNFKDSLNDIEKLLKIIPDDKEVLKQKARVKAARAKEENKKSNMFKKMFQENTFYKEEIVDLNDPNNPKVYMDVEVQGEETPQKYHLEFVLYENIVPKTAKNFLALCTGEKGSTMHNGQEVALSYKNSIFHRVIKGFMMQGGDFTDFNGRGGVSIYGEKFQDENFKAKHTSRGQLSMANAGPNTNGSQFFITFGATPHLDGKHTVFGRMTKGEEFLDVFENLQTDSNDKPTNEVKIIDCGLVQ